MATIPALHSRWRCRDTGDVVEVEEVSRVAGVWCVAAKRLDPGDGAPKIIARAHWFCTEGYEPVLEVSGADH